MSVARSAGRQQATVIITPGPKRNVASLAWKIMVWCFRLLWLNPLLWPVLIPLHISLWAFAALGRAGKGAIRKYSTKDSILLSDGKLSTLGAVPLFVLLAGLILQLGELLGSLDWWRQSSRFSRMRSFEARRAKTCDETEDLLHTPPSSPPPFDLLSPSEARMAGGRAEVGEERQDNGEGGVLAPTLRERLRNAATAMNMIRSIGVGAFYEKRDPHMPASEQADIRLGINRSMLAYNLFEEIKKDYKVTYERFPPMSEESPERDAELQRVHERCAKKCLELARTNGGLYTKAAQFVASLQGGAGDKGIPRAYVDVLRVLTDSAPYHEFEGTQFTCFTRTTAQILTLQVTLRDESSVGGRVWQRR
jgi:hypothetical protein